MKIFVWIALLVIWLRLDWLAGLKKNKKNYASPYTKKNAEATFFDDGVEWMKQLEDDCLNAVCTIDIMFFILQPDDAGQRLMKLLVKKAREGVRVRLMLDAIGSRSFKKSLKHIPHEEVIIQFSRPFSFKGSWFFMQKRNHKKLAVIDKKIAHVGGFNIGLEYLHLDPVLTPWRDYHLRLTGEITQDCQTEFERDWREEFVEPDSAGNGQYQLVSSEAVDQEAFICSLLQKASSSIFIGSPYFIPTQKVETCLFNALEKGVKLTVLVPGTPDHPLVQPASYRYLRRLISKGADIYQFQNGFYHAKAILIDGKLCDIGTMNFDRRSLLINEELNVVTEDVTVIHSLKTSFEKDLAESVKLKQGDLKVQPIKESAAWCVGHLL
ncbi:phospholipase D-like domain-containing protein [Jeotgalibacillus haloalkalitolerans]|uniref:Phosphatidylserine/phosphatidylglycerophosphate/ cardiolipin synthase family protein n=1 Tax=Jeotgalibacillus haloalkalitolerans TaxID=3104292 RepID=A0ABU5KIX5_9BACL|nr:phosphatidylserine/phosphatidylglycerophosphate/cardiolipin synthase family protein [Jeotgalibacillus sp. HH7-29]MDZ5711200.1 phosphatidylserine/phosphatidylglycerophosphate/cardiolipin synthase family protein [Jeotgalibacillus sp. HH7-29]